MIKASRQKAQITWEGKLKKVSDVAKLTYKARL
jgi:hypothetical protein